MRVGAIFVGPMLGIRIFGLVRPMKSFTTEVFLNGSTRWGLAGAIFGALALTNACIATENPPSGSGAAPNAGGSVGVGGAAPIGGGLVGGGNAGGSGGSGGSSGGGPSSGGVVNIGGQLPLGGVPETVECQGTLPTEANAEAPHKVTVQGSMSWGELPHFWSTYGVGRYGLYLQEDRGWGQLLKDHTVDGVQNLDLKMLRMHGLFHDDMGIYNEDEAGNPVFDFTKSDQIFDFFVENDIDSIVELAPMPSKLASDPTQTVFDWNMGISPPKDYDRWRAMVQAFVQHSVERYGQERVGKWYWEVWNEPECCSNKFWTGSLDDYLKLYDYSSAGVRAVLPNAKMGGPVASQSVELAGNSMSGVKFLDHISAGTSLAPTLEKPVLGFFAYHTWSFVGGAVDGYFDGLDLLDSKGFNDIQIAITEFGPTWEFGLENEPQEMTQGAAFVAQVYSDVSRRVVQEGRRFPIAHAWWVLSDVFDEGKYREGDPFIGCMGLTSREGIHKPAYNVYKFLAQMGNRQLAFNIESPGDVGGMAARDDQGGIQIILYHGQDPGRGPADDKYYTVAGGQDVTVSLEGLDPEVAYNVTEYRVDDTHGNAYGVWQSQNRPAMEAMTEDQWAALRSNMDSQPSPLGSALCGSTFKKTVSLGSPGVVFLTLTPAVPE
jgi:xylan 1,4-beta-xylosidase